MAKAEKAEVKAVADAKAAAEKREAAAAAESAKAEQAQTHAKAKKSEEISKAEDEKFAEFFSELCEADIYPDTEGYRSMTKVLMARKK